jgi:hypothetical protein
MDVCRNKMAFLTARSMESALRWVDKHTIDSVVYTGDRWGALWNTRQRLEREEFISSMNEASLLSSQWASMA